MFEANMEQNLKWGSQRGGLSKKPVLYLYNSWNKWAVTCVLFIFHWWTRDSVSSGFLKSNFILFLVPCMYTFCLVFRKFWYMFCYYNGTNALAQIVYFIYVLPTWYLSVAMLIQFHVQSKANINILQVSNNFCLIYLCKHLQ